jgi:hypothetical protein
MHIGLINGQKIIENRHILTSEKLKQVSHLDAASVDFIVEHNNEVSAILNEAILLNL